MRALRFCLGMYRAVGYLTISQFVASPVRATASVKVYTLEPLFEALDVTAICVPAQIALNVEIYIDDLQWDVEAYTEQEAASAFGDMADVLRDVI